MFLNVLLEGTYKCFSPLVMLSPNSEGMAHNFLWESLKEWCLGYKLLYQPYYVKHWKWWGVQGKLCIMWPFKDLINYEETLWLKSLSMIDESGCDRYHSIRKYGYSMRGILLCDQQLLVRSRCLLLCYTYCKKVSPKEASLLSNGATEPKTDSMAEFPYLCSLCKCILKYVVHSEQKLCTFE